MTLGICFRNFKFRLVIYIYIYMDKIYKAYEKKIQKKKKKKQ